MSSKLLTNSPAFIHRQSLLNSLLMSWAVGGDHFTLYSLSLAWGVSQEFEQQVAALKATHPAPAMIEAQSNQPFAHS